MAVEIILNNLNPQVLDTSCVVSDFGQVSILSVAHEKKTSGTQGSGHNSLAIICGLWSFHQCIVLLTC